MVGRSTLDAPISEGGRGLVAAHEQHDAVERVAADRLLDVHAGEVAVEHRRGTQQRLAQGHHRELEREAARVQHAQLHVLGERAEMRVAGRELGIGVADADDRPAVELVLGDAAVLHPPAIDEAHLALAPEPLLAATAFAAGHARDSPRGRGASHGALAFHRRLCGLPRVVKWSGQLEARRRGYGTFDQPGPGSKRWIFSACAVVEAPRSFS